MKLPLFLAAAVALSALAFTPSASAAQCNFWIEPTGNPGVVWQTYDFATQTAYNTTCGFVLGLANETCEFLIGSPC